MTVFVRLRDCPFDGRGKRDHLHLGETCKRLETNGTHECACLSTIYGPHPFFSQPLPSAVNYPLLQPTSPSLVTPQLRMQSTCVHNLVQNREHRVPVALSGTSVTRVLEKSLPGGCADQSAFQDQLSILYSCALCFVSNHLHEHSTRQNCSGQKVIQFTRTYWQAALVCEKCELC